MENAEIMINCVSVIEDGAEKVFENVNLSDVDDMLEEYNEEYDVSYEENLFEKTEDHEIWMNRGYIHIPELKIKVHDIIFCQKDENSGEFDPDFSGWMFFDDETDELLYEEGYSSFSSALWNGFHRSTESLKCDVYI